MQSRLLDMPWSDWKIDPSELTIMTKPDGSEWLLGAGASGRVSPSPVLLTGGEDLCQLPHEAVKLQSRASVVVIHYLVQCNASGCCLCSILSRKQYECMGMASKDRKLMGPDDWLQVYKALRNGVQIVAVKLFKEEMTRGAISSLTSPQHARQFRQEISILKSCHDKNIVQFLGACLTVRCCPKSQHLVPVNVSSIALHRMSHLIHAGESVKQQNY